MNIHDKARSRASRALRTWAWNWAKRQEQGIVHPASLFHEDFSTAVPAGTRAAVPGPGNLLVGDVGTRLSLDVDVVKAAGGSANDQKFVSGDSYARSAAGRIFVFHNELRLDGGDQFVAATNSAGNLVAAGLNINNETLRINPNFATIDATIAEAPYWRVINPRAAGELMFIRGGKWRSWNLVYIRRSGTASPLYASFLSSLQPEERFDRMLVPDVEWTASPLISDSFNRANGAIGSSDSYDGGVSGAWSNVLGTAEVISNAAGFSALSGGSGIARIDAGNKNVSLIGSMSRSGGRVGLTFRDDGAGNCLIGYHDGTLLVLAKRIGGADPVIIVSKATPFVANAELQAHASYDEITLIYGDVSLENTPRVLNPSTEAALFNGTGVGFYSTDTGNRIENFAVWPRGTGGEYDATLFAYAQRRESRKKHIIYNGDSITFGPQIDTSYPMLVANTLGRNRHAYTNMAESGKKVSRMLEEAVNKGFSLMECYEESIFVLLGGTNDLHASASADSVYNDILALCQLAKAAGAAHVIVETILPRSNLSAGNETSRQTVNTNIKNNFPGMGYTVVDIASHPDLDDASNLTYYSDGVHPTLAGNTIIAGMLAPVIDAL